MKKSFVISLCLAFCLSLFAVPSFAAEVPDDLSGVPGYYVRNDSTLLADGASVTGNITGEALIDGVLHTFTNMFVGAGDRSYLYITTRTDYLSVMSATYVNITSVSDNSSTRKMLSYFFDVFTEFSTSSSQFIGKWDKTGVDQVDLSFTPDDSYSYPFYGSLVGVDGKTYSFDSMHISSYNGAYSVTFNTPEDSLFYAYNVSSLTIDDFTSDILPQYLIAFQDVFEKQFTVHQPTPMELFMSGIGDFFSQSLTWLATVISTVVSRPALVLTVLAMPIVGFSVVFFKRIANA